MGDWGILFGLGFRRGRSRQREALVTSPRGLFFAVRLAFRLFCLVIDTNLPPFLETKRRRFQNKIKSLFPLSLKKILKAGFLSKKSFCF